MNTLVTLLAAASLSAACITPARADVMYNLIVDTVTSSFPTVVAPAPFVSFDVSDGIASLDEVGAGQYGNTNVISSSGSVTLTVNEETATVGRAYGTVMFFTDSVTMYIQFLGVFTDLTLMGNSSGVSGSYGSDAPGACDGGVNTCGFTGHFIKSVPEPNTMLLLSAGLVGLAVVSRRTRRS